MSHWGQLKPENISAEDHHLTPVGLPPLGLTALSQPEGFTTDLETSLPPESQEVFEVGGAEEESCYTTTMASMFKFHRGSTRPPSGRNTPNYEGSKRIPTPIPKGVPPYPSTPTDKCSSCKGKLQELKKQAMRLWMLYAEQKAAAATEGKVLDVQESEILTLIERRLHQIEESSSYKDVCSSCGTPSIRMRREAMEMVQSIGRVKGGDAPKRPQHPSGGSSQIPGPSSKQSQSNLPRTTPHFTPQNHRLARQGGYLSDGGGWHSAGVKQRSNSQQTGALMEHKPPQPPRIPRRQQTTQLSSQMTSFRGDGSGRSVSMTAASDSIVQQNGSVQHQQQPEHSGQGHRGLSSRRPAHLQLHIPPAGSVVSPSQTRVSSPASSSNSAGSASAAVSFFARAAQKLSMSRKKRKSRPPEPEPPPFPTNFCEIIRRHPPQLPAGLVRAIGRCQGPASGKVKVSLRVCPVESAHAAFLNVDPTKNQVIVRDPSNSGILTSANRRTGISGPKLFAFDGVYPQDYPLNGICESSLTEIIEAVVSGADGCLFCYGHARLGKTYTMIGLDDSTRNLGIVPCAIAWLFKLIQEQREKTGARFSVRVSAVEVTGKQETLKDLLVDVAQGTEAGGNVAPGVYLREDPISGTQLENQSELRAPTADVAAYYLDAAIAARTVPEADEDARNSHLLFTLHVYQYRLDKSSRNQDGVAGGRSRLHLLDLGSCSKTSKDGNALSLSALGTVIMALLNGQRHVPYRDSKLTQLLRESLGSMSCRTCMIAHVSPALQAYNETLQVLQVAARIHRMKPRKSRLSSASASSDSGSSCDDSKRIRPRMRMGIRMGTLREDSVLSSSGKSENDYSSSEMSCDTVIYTGPGGRPLSDRELTDNEGPPSVIYRPFSRETRSSDESQCSSPARYAKSLTGFHSTSRTSNHVDAHRKTRSETGSPIPGGVVQLPRKFNVHNVQHLLHLKSKSKSSLQSGGGEEKWIDGPGAYSEPQHDSRMQSSQEQWIDGPNAVQYSECWIDGPQLVQRKSAEEQWVDGPSAMVVKPDPSCELWVDGPKEFQVQTQAAPQAVPAFQRTESVTSKESSHPAVQHRNPIQNPHVVHLAKSERPLSQYSTDSQGSMAVNPAHSRPVSVHSAENVTDSDTVQRHLSGEIRLPGEQRPLEKESLVEHWVEKHSSMSDHGGCRQKAAKSKFMRQIKNARPGMRRGHSESPERRSCMSDSAVSGFNSKPQVKLRTKKTSSSRDLVRNSATEEDKRECRSSISTEEAQKTYDDSPECDRLHISETDLQEDTKPSEIISKTVENDKDTSVPKDSVDLPCAEPFSEKVSIPQEGKSYSDIHIPSIEEERLDISELLRSNRESIYELQMDDELERHQSMSRLTFSSEEDLGPYKMNKDETETCDYEEADTSRIDSELQSLADSSLEVIEILDSVLESASTQECSKQDESNDRTKAESEKGSKIAIRPTSLLPKVSSEISKDKQKKDTTKSGIPKMSPTKPPISAKPQSLQTSKTNGAQTKSKTVQQGKNNKPASAPKSTTPKTDPTGDVKPSKSQPNTSTPKQCSKSSQKLVSRSHHSQSPSPVGRASPKCSPGTKDNGRSPSPATRGGQKGTKSSSPSPKNGSDKPKCKSILKNSTPSATNSPSVSSVRSSSARPSPSARMPIQARSKSQPSSIHVSFANGKDGKSSPRSSKSSKNSSKLPLSRPRHGSERSKCTDSDSGIDSGHTKGGRILSPYAVPSNPRFSRHSSSGHGSDNSSSFSGNMPRFSRHDFAMSSGYESMLRDSECTSQDSMSETGLSVGRERNMNKKSQSENRRSKSAPARAELPKGQVKTREIFLGAPRHLNSTWVDTRNVENALEEPMEICNYDEDDVERVARRRKEETERAVIRRRKRISELLGRQEVLKKELTTAKVTLMADTRSWSFDLYVAKQCRDDLTYLQALEKETSILEKRVEACKSRIMLVTCFDANSSTSALHTSVEAEV